MTPTDIDKLLRRYIARFESGGDTNPGDLLSEADADDRAELSALIEGYLELAAPAQEWDSEAFEGSASERAVARAVESWSEASGELPHELVDLRQERKIKRSEVVSRLAEWLGVGDQEEKVGLYYHRLERGSLDAERVSPKVFDGLASILGSTAEKLRLAGRTAPSAGAAESGIAYARLARPSPDQDLSLSGVLADKSAEHPEDASTESDRDEVDRLFTGD